MRRALIFIVALIAAVAVLVPTGAASAGGTVAYSAPTYSFWGPGGTTDFWTCSGFRIQDGAAVRITSRAPSGTRPFPAPSATARRGRAGAPGGHPTSTGRSRPATSFASRRTGWSSGRPSTNRVRTAGTGRGTRPSRRSRQGFRGERSRPRPATRARGRTGTPRPDVRAPTTGRLSQPLFRRRRERAGRLAPLHRPHVVRPRRGRASRRRRRPTRRQHPGAALRAPRRSRRRPLEPQALDGRVRSRPGDRPRAGRRCRDRGLAAALGARRRVVPARGEHELLRTGVR